jgi:hypothetical protein
LWRRKAWIETIFGDGKERRGLRRAHFRGIDRVRIQAWRTATAKEIRHLARCLHKGPSLGVVALAIPPNAPGLFGPLMPGYHNRTPQVCLR